MSRKREEITNIIERLELLEEKFGIALSGLYAHGGPGRVNGEEVYYMEINFELTSLSGKLEQDVWINACVYNSAGQLLQTVRDIIYAEHFTGFRPVTMCLYTYGFYQPPEKIRLFPSANTP